MNETVETLILFLIGWGAVMFAGWLRHVYMMRKIDREAEKQRRAGMAEFERRVQAIKDGHSV